MGETRYRDLVEPQPSLYLPVRQFAGPVPTSLAVRTYDDAASVLPQLPAVLQQVHPELMLAGGGSVQQLMAEPLARPRFAALLLSTFAIVTLLLAVVGIYGALAFATRQRTREIGVKRALWRRLAGCPGRVSQLDRARGLTPDGSVLTLRQR